MDGLLVVDKPVGPTSHDVVARVRRVLGERRVGHTGTLDPAASGVLPLVIGRATRLARFLSGGDKSYDAVVRLGTATDTYDAETAPAEQPTLGAAMPSRAAIDLALEEFRGTFLQQPPAFSAKKIGGTRSYELARKAQARRAPLAPPAPVAPLAPVPVTARRIDIVAIDGDTVTLRIDCSAGFYVRALAHDLGQRLGVGAHLAALRRLATAGLTLAAAMPLEAAERDPAAARAAVVPLAGMLRDLSAVVLTEDGVRRAVHGRDLGPGDAPEAARSAFEALLQAAGPAPTVRLLDPAGALVGIAEPSRAAGLLHPSVVLV